MAYGEDGLQHMILQGEDVTGAIRENAVSRYASQVSAYPEVRTFLLEMQRDLARTHNVIMDGRDIGTVVLPQADLKIFLTASVEERARGAAQSWPPGARGWTWPPSRRRLPSGTTTTPTGPPPPAEGGRRGGGGHLPHGLGGESGGSAYPGEREVIPLTLYQLAYVISKFFFPL